MDEFIQLWKAYDAKLDQSLQLNLKLLKEVQSQKTRSVLRTLTAGRVIGLVLGVLYEIILCVVCWHVRDQPVMAISVGVFIVVTGIAMGAYWWELVLIGRIGYADNIVDTQEKLAGIQSSIIRTLRISWIQLPFWATFFVSNGLIRNGGPVFWAVEIPLVLAFTVVAIILFRNLTPEKMEQKKWVRKLAQGTGWKSVTRAIGFMQEIREFKEE
ncbi:MAG TPA: hypothetical protein VKR41_07635 [Puia sp.]|nr:hypothetical protein [Puia sp.]